MRFPVGEHERFKQILVLVKRLEEYNIPTKTEAAYTPTMPRKKSHLTMLTASSMMGTLLLTSDEGYLT